MSYAWYPYPGPQYDFCSRWEEEVLFGGAAGPGKTDCLIMDALRYVDFPDYRSIIFRRTHPEMLDILDRMQKAYPLHGGEYRAGEHRWYFPSGAKIHLGHMADVNSEYAYQGKEFHDIRFDEAGQFLPKQLLYLFSRLRTTNPKIPKRMRYASNPGGPAHQFLKDRFQIGQYPQGYQTFDDRTYIELPDGSIIDETIHRIFIPGRVWDNPSIIKNDPAYIANLSQLPEIERLRLMDGVWDAFEGQMFQELNKEVHGFTDTLPSDWETFGAFDWGYARPWCYGIFRVDYDGRIYLEVLHYGCSEKESNRGVRMTDSEIARKIREIESEARVKVKWRVAGADIFNPKRRKDGVLGPAPADEMSREGVHFLKADNNRILGWQQIHHRLKVDDQGLPWLFIKKDLEDAWRTLWALQEDPKNPEDIPTRDIEDHIPEMVRYACMTRPMRPRKQPPSDAGSFQAERRRFIKAKQYAHRHGISLVAAYGKV